MIETTREKKLSETVRTLNESNKITDAIHSNIVRIYELNIEAFESIKEANHKEVDSTIMDIVLIIMASIIIGIVFATIMSKIFGDKAR
jgi:hypothetical protein